MSNEIQVMRQVLDIPDQVSEKNPENPEMPDLNLSLIYRLSALLLTVALIIPWGVVGSTKSVNFVSTYFELADQREIYEEARAEKLTAMDKLENRGTSVNQYKRQKLPIGSEREITAAIRSEKGQTRVLQAKIEKSKEQETRFVEQYKSVYEQLQKLRQSGANSSYAEQRFKVLEKSFPPRVVARAKKEIQAEKDNSVQ